MKVKEISLTANIAWSPSKQYPIYLAGGTAAQQLDATFSTSASLDLFSLDLSDPQQSMQKVASKPSECRFSKLVWGTHGMSEGLYPNGTLVTGGDNGALYVWDPAAIMSGRDGLVQKLTKHTGPVAALDINPFQCNLLASGASESDIYIWDLNNPSNPMTPGAKSQPPDDVSCVAWNQQVQHIMASTYAGRCVVWDLRKNEPIIKVSDSVSRIKCKMVAWHPDVATQLCLGSEDDHSPFIQLWDLRFATSPLKCLESHQRGILSLSWCSQDADLLLSCGKDNRVLCWNPNTALQSGEVVYELPTTDQWNFDVQWCPRNPSLISTCSFEGHVSVYSLIGSGSSAPPPQMPAGVISNDPFAQVGQQIVTPQTQRSTLTKAPKWLKRPVGANFGFGGKLITFETSKPVAANQQQQQHQQQMGVGRSAVRISQVLTEESLVSRSEQLENALTTANYAEFCMAKVVQSKSDVEESIWKFLKVHFEDNPRIKYLQLLGFDENQLLKKVTEMTGVMMKTPKVNDSENADLLVENMNNLTASTTAPGAAPSNGTLAFDQIAQNSVEKEVSESPISFDMSTDCEGLLTRALLVANFEAAVEICLHSNKHAEAIILAISGGPELLMKTQKKVLSSVNNGVNRLLSSIVTHDFEHVMRHCDLKNWREALALALTYSKPEDFSSLCDILGSRLERENDGELSTSACLCYICAGNIDHLVSCWLSITNDSTSPSDIQNLIEKVSILRKAVETQMQTEIPAGGPIAKKMTFYAGLLAAQGSLQTALNYLGNSQDPYLVQMRDRLSHSLGLTASIYNTRQTTPQKFENPTRQGLGRYQPTVPPNTAFTDSRKPVELSNYGAPTSKTPPTNQPKANFEPVSPLQPTSLNKGALSKRYPSAANEISNPSSIGNSYFPNSNTVPYAQPSLNPSGFNSSSIAPANGPPNVFTPSTVQPNPVQPSIFTPSNVPSSQHTPGAPNNPVASDINNQLPPQPSYQETRPVRAWNDPPPIREKKNTSASQPYDAPAPITAPVYGAPQPEQSPPGAPYYSGAPAPNYHSSVSSHPNVVNSSPPAPAPEPPAPVIKGPIPEAHQILEQTFGALVASCQQKANTQQIKRKLDEVSKKLEILYDKLRENRLTENVTNGLHQIAHCIKSYDYQSSLTYHTQLISAGNFSEISAFMPGIKVLIQIATQLQVFLG